MKKKLEENGHLRPVKTKPFRVKGKQPTTFDWRDAADAVHGKKQGPVRAKPVEKNDGGEP
jgi:hypothetical protein